MLAVREFCFDFPANVTSGRAEGDRVGCILDYTAHVSDINFDEGDEIPSFLGRIEFRNVSFKSPMREAFVLWNVSFVIEPG
jgi:ABC-type multidrug transport system fused ATPase/permease subunit